MCGITGFYSQSSRFSEDNLKQMTSAIQHRGPDAAGYYFERTIGLGHRRLSIIDLSSSANQPMESHSGRYVICYNGEIYNFQQIAKGLNVKLKTKSDTEVILEAFEQYGVEFVNQLQGMFAIAIYDKVDEKLFLFRDRLGIKPIFYYWDGKDFAFASEIKALTTLNFNLKVNKSAISKFLYLGYIPQPETIYGKIFKFPSGSYAVVNKQGISFNSYWHPDEKVSRELITDEATAKKELKQLLVQSVEKRLISDVPIGTFLSGGIDSSLVTAIAQSITKEPVKTFSIGFKENKFNEATYAREVANYLGTDHHEFIVSEQDTLKLVEDYFNAYDEPYADSSGFPTMLVSKLAREYVTVTLSGDGGDELFYGYGAYQWANRLSNPAVQLFRKPIAFGLSQLSNRHKRAAKVFQYPDKTSIKSHIFSQEQYFFSQKEIDQLLTTDYNFKIDIDETHNTARNLSPVEAQALFDLKHYLKDDLLVKVDRASMKYSLETRVPLLDHEVVEFALNLSQDLKIKDGVQKYLLKQVLYDYVPKKYFDRPKWGFSIPMVKWLKSDLKYLIDNYLSKEVVESINVVSFEVVNNLINRFLKGEDYLYNRIWTLVVLHKHLKDNKETIS